MPLLARKPEWHRQLRETGAAQTFIICRPAEFPLDQIRAFTGALLEVQTIFGVKKTLPRQSQAADEQLLDELRPLQHELYTYEAAVLGCLHLFTFDLARGHLHNRIKPDLETANTDEFFNSRISVYLQCVIIANRADPHLVHDVEAAAARELLQIHHVEKAKRFPSVIRLFTTLRESNCEELLPYDFVTEVFRRAQYKRKLSSKMAALRREQAWSDTYRLVDGLRDFPSLPETPLPIKRWLPEMFDNYAMWASWRPDPARLGRWASQLLPRHRTQLGRVFELEGPDTTSQQRQTLRASSEGAFPGSRAQGYRHGRDILDVLLAVLDQAIAIGPHAVDLFIRICVQDAPTLRWHMLLQVEAGLEPRQDPTAETLCNYLRALEPHTSIRDRVASVTAVLGLLRTSPALQGAFGDTTDLARRGPSILSAAQQHFCDLLLHHRPAEAVGLQLYALGRALLGSPWLATRWKPAFIAMLREQPNEDEIVARFAAVRRAEADGRPDKAQAQLDYLGACLGGSLVVGQASPPAAPPVVIEDPIWRAELDNDRAALRRALGRIAGLDLAVATACLQAAAAAHDAFVRDMANRAVAGSDQACVNLADDLGGRVARRGPHSVAECWRQLLLHMMRLRPRGLLARLGDELEARSWHKWIENLRGLYGDDHLEPQGGLGFTMEEIRAITSRRMGIGRMHSQNTCSTVEE